MAVNPAIVLTVDAGSALHTVGEFTRRGQIFKPRIMKLVGIDGVGHITTWPGHISGFL